MRRRPEAYHATLRRHDTDVAAAAPTSADEDGAGTPASIHDAVRTKEAGLSSRLHYDDHERRSGLVRFLPTTTTPKDVAAAEERELGDFVAGAFATIATEPGRLAVRRDGSVAAGRGREPVRVEKALTLGGDRASPSLGLEVRVENLGERPIEARLGLEWSLMLLGGGRNPAAWYELDGRRSSHDASGSSSGVGRLAQGNDDVGIVVTTTASPAADAWWAPIETISNSEGGFERIYQGSGLLLSWPVRLEPGAHCIVRVDHVVGVARDRAAAESAAATSGA
jgi:alpha-amylase